jgi:hypothetical protein
MKKDLFREGDRQIINQIGHKLYDLKVNLIEGGK